MPITELQLRSLTDEDAGKRLRDGGSLFGTVRINRAGRIVVGWHFRYRTGDGVRQIAVGTWPAMTMVAIRKQRDAYRVDKQRGHDPLEDKKATKLAGQAEQAEALASHQQRLHAIAVAAQRMTVEELFTDWERAKLSKRKNGSAEVRRMFAKDVLPRIGAMAVEDVRRGHIAAMLDKVRERGVKRMANMLLELVRQMFRHAVARDWIEADPTAVLRKADFGGKEVERDRNLEEAEIRELRDKLPAARLSPATEAALWIMLATACRVGELSMAKWADVDLERRLWRIPPDTAKNGQEHVITVSDFAAQQFAILKQVQFSPVWVFPNRTDTGHLDEKTIAKQVRDRQRDQPMSHRSKNAGTLRLSGGAWTPHDLRRTAATLMGELDVPENVIERCLNHLEPNRMKRIYQRQRKSIAAAKADAWHRLGAHLEWVLEAESKNVIPFEAKAA